MEPQDLMLLMDKDGEGEKDDSGLQWEQTMRGTGGRGRGEDVKMVHQHSIFSIFSEACQLCKLAFGEAIQKQYMSGEAC